MPVKLKFYNSLFLTFLQLNCPLVFIYTEIVYVNIETIIILTKINNTLFTVFFFNGKAQESIAIAKKASTQKRVSYFPY